MCALNYNNLFVSLLWGNFRFVESWRSRANNDIKLFYFYVLLLKCLIYSQGSVLIYPKISLLHSPRKRKGGGEKSKRGSGLFRFKISKENEKSKWSRVAED